MNKKETEEGLEIVTLKELLEKCIAMEKGTKKYEVSEDFSANEFVYKVNKARKDGLVISAIKFSNIISVKCYSID